MTQSRCKNKKRKRKAQLILKHIEKEIIKQYFFSFGNLFWPPFSFHITREIFLSNFFLSFCFYYFFLKKKFFFSLAKSTKKSICNNASRNSKCPSTAKKNDRRSPTKSLLRRPPTKSLLRRPRNRGRRAVSPNAWATSRGSRPSRRCSLAACACLVGRSSTRFRGAG